MTEPGHEASQALADGRVVEYWEGGDPRGRAMVLHPGTPATRLLGRWGHEAAVSAGVRLVSVSRPGYGGSTVVTAQAPSLLAVGRDTAALAAHLGLAEYAVVGISGGGPFAVATAVADSEAVRALGLVAGVGPWRLLDDPSSLPDERVCLALLDAGDVAGAWAGFRLLCERALSGLRALDDSARVDALMAGEDGPLTRDEAYRAIWADNLRVVLDSLDGCAFDNLAWGGAWDIDPRDVAAPTRLWYGELDHEAPPAYGQWHRDRIARSQMTVYPGEGHLDVCDAHWREVVEGLLSIWG
jgi:pimeloyl-ACP methyl ester carboxylesterase